MPNERDIADNLARARGEIARVAGECGRGDSVRLLAVTKGQSAAAVMAAYGQGQRLFGESYVDEALAKMAETRRLGAEDIEWHFIGPMQGNKTGKIAAAFAWAHSLCSEKHAARLSRQRAGMPPLNVCVQVNISGELSKSGVAPADAVKFARRIAGLPNLRLRGVMGMPRAETAPDKQRAAFAALARIYHELAAAGWGTDTLSGAGPHAPSIDTLSMGMSGDMAAAIMEGATMVRIGSAIFGLRVGD